MAIDVQPRRGRRLSRTEDRDVLPAVVGEAAEPVEELELRLRRDGLACRGRGAGAGCADGAGDLRRALEADDLVGQAAPAAQQDGPRRGLQQRPVLGGDPVAAQDVDAAATSVALGREDRLAGPDERLERVLQVLRVRRAVLVEDHEVDVEELQPPVLVGAEQLADDAEVLELVDPHQDDRQVARDAVRPRARVRRGALLREQVRRRPQRRIRVEDPVGEALEEVRLVGVDAEVMELHLGLGPGERRGALERGRLAVLVGEVEDLARAIRRRPWRRSRARSRPARAGPGGAG